MKYPPSSVSQVVFRVTYCMTRVLKLISSKMEASIYGRLRLSSLEGSRSLGTTESSSSCSLYFWTSVLLASTIMAHNIVVAEVSVPARSKSRMINMTSSILPFSGDVTLDETLSWIFRTFLDFVPECSVELSGHLFEDGELLASAR